MIKLLESLNVKIIKKKANCYILKSNTPKSLTAPYDLVRKMRASFSYIGPFLSRYGSRRGIFTWRLCNWNKTSRFHLNCLKKMGASFVIKNGYIKGKCKR